MFELHIVKMCREAEFLHAYVWRNGIVQICAFLTEWSLATSGVFVPLLAGVFVCVLWASLFKRQQGSSQSSCQLASRYDIVVRYDKHACIV